MPYRKFPTKDEYPPYFEQYLAKVVDTRDIIAQLKRQQKDMLELISSLSEDQLNYAYAEGKWTIKELITHIIDTERIFSYRALSFARGEKNSLLGFDHDDYVRQSYANEKSKFQLKEEYETNRQATIELFRGFEDNCVSRMGTANGLQMSVRALLYIVVGHELHHFQVLQERYL